MKVGALSIREDAARVKAVREAIGPRALLMLDANVRIPATGQSSLPAGGGIRYLPSEEPVAPS